MKTKAIERVTGSLKRKRDRLARRRHSELMAQIPDVRMRRYNKYHAHQKRQQSLRDWSSSWLKEYERVEQYED